MNQSPNGPHAGDLRVHVINPSPVNMVIDFDLDATSNENSTKTFLSQGTKVFAGDDVYLDYTEVFAQRPLGGERTIARCLISSIRACPADPPPDWPKNVYFTPFAGRRCMKLGDVRITSSANNGRATGKRIVGLVNTCVSFDEPTFTASRFSNKCNEAVSVLFYSVSHPEERAQFDLDIGQAVDVPLVPMMPMVLSCPKGFHPVHKRDGSPITGYAYNDADDPACGN